MWEWSNLGPRADPAGPQHSERPTMSDPETKASLASVAPGRPLSPEARRALEEAAQRRAEIDARAAELARSKEHQGRGGLEPVRYADWEVKGLASDF
jgi:hypothetical protein